MRRHSSGDVRRQAGVVPFGLAFAVQDVNEVLIVEHGPTNCKGMADSGSAESQGFLTSSACLVAVLAIFHREVCGRFCSRRVRPT